VDWNKSIFGLSDVRILLYLDEKDTASYTDLLKNVVQSRSTLASSLTQLAQAHLVERKVHPSKPIRTDYRLTAKGKSLVELLKNMQQLLAP
jgi:DNA-binding HxlR family transcriptional regulator